MEDATMAFDIDIDHLYSAGERQFILYEYFQKHTRKGHAASRKEIEAYLNTFDIKISPQTFYNDLDVLRGTMKLDIRFDPHVHNKGAGGYWLANPRFEPRELRMMVDGIQSLKFITQHKAQEITRKIKDLADVHTVATLNRQTFVPDRVRNMEDSVVASLSLEVGEDGEVYLYAGNVINKRARSGPIRLVKIDALTGEILWENQNEIKGKYASAPAKKGLYAGLVGSPVVGQGEISDLVIFNVNSVVDGKQSYAVVYALDKLTGEEVWSQPLDVTSVSSPIALYQPDGKSYIVLGDDNGTLRLMDGYSGLTLSTLNLGSEIQCSPAAYGNSIVVGTVGGMPYFVDLL